MTAQTSNWNPKKAVSKNPYFQEFLPKFSSHNAESVRNKKRNSFTNLKKRKLQFSLPKTQKNLFWGEKNGQKARFWKIFCNFPFFYCWMFFRSIFPTDSALWPYKPATRTQKRRFLKTPIFMILSHILVVIMRNR